MANVFDAHSIMRLPVAIVLDIFGFICLGLASLGTVGIFVGQALSMMSDVLGLVFLGSKNPGKDKAQNKAKKSIKKIFFAKLIPFFGDFVPWWTINELSAARQQ